MISKQSHDEICIAAAQAAARAYRRRCSWVDVDELTNDAMEAILKARYDPARAPKLTAKKEKLLEGDDLEAERMRIFYRWCGIRWLSTVVAKQLSPVSGSSHVRHALHRTRGEVAQASQDNDAPSTNRTWYSPAHEMPSTELEDAQVRAGISVRLAELMADQEGAIAYAFLLRPDTVLAKDIATLWGTSESDVWAAAYKLRQRASKDRKLRSMLDQLTGRD